MRYDYFIIWNTPHTEEIINLVDCEFKIIFEKEIIINDMDKFVMDVYACDTVPFEHLIAKSRYLLKAEKKAYFLLVENHNPRETIVGDGAFRHVQCLTIVDFKTKVRRKFNPEPEHHVIHGSDYESQVKYLLKYLKFPSLDYFYGFSNKIDVKSFLRDMPYRYVIIRMADHFPNYKTGEDLDIICDSVYEVIRWLQERGEFVLSHNGDNTHVDFITDGIEFRFDLLDKFGNLRDEILENRVKKRGVYVPALEYDLAIRFLEYKKHPEKVKHLEYCKLFNINYQDIVSRY